MLKMEGLPVCDQHQSNPNILADRTSSPSKALESSLLLYIGINNMKIHYSSEKNKREKISLAVLLTACETNRTAFMKSWMRCFTCRTCYTISGVLAQSTFACSSSGFPFNGVISFSSILSSLRFGQAAPHI